MRTKLWTIPHIGFYVMTFSDFLDCSYCTTHTYIAVLLSWLCIINCSSDSQHFKHHWHCTKLNRVHSKSALNFSDNWWRLNRSKIQSFLKLPMLLEIISLKIQIVSLLSNLPISHFVFIVCISVQLCVLCVNAASQQVYSASLEVNTH